jgi:hypothetical protein
MQVNAIVKSSLFSAVFSAAFCAVRRAPLPAALACAACGSRSELYDLQGAAAAAAGAGGASTSGASTGGAGAGGAGAGAGGASTGGAGSGGAGVSCQPGTLTPMVTSESGAFSIAVDSEQLYWGTLDGDVASQPLAGGAPSLIATHQTPVALATDADRLYWLDASKGTLVAHDKSGGGLVVLATQQYGTGRLTLDDDYLYWTSYESNVIGRVMRADKDGSNVTVLASQVDQTMDVAVDEQAVYFTVWGAGKGVFRVDKQGGEVTSLIPELDIDSPAVTGIAVRDGIAYVAVDDKFYTGQIWSVPTTGGAHAVFVDQITSPLELAVDATHVYWTAAGAKLPYGTVGRAPIDGGPAEVVATTQEVMRGLTLDEHAVYFGRNWGFEMPAPADSASVLRWCKTP